MANVYILNGALIKSKNNETEGYVVDSRNVQYLGSGNIQSVSQKLLEIDALKTRINELESRINELENASSTPSATINSQSITRPQNSTVSSILWSGSVPSIINSGSTGQLTRGTVTATMSGNSNAIATITTSNFTNTPTIESSNTTVITIGTIVKNGATTITAIENGSATIIVKDGSTVVNSFSITVTNESLNKDVTSSTTFSVDKGSISGTTITAPTVTEDTMVTVTATYSGKSASQTYTAKAEIIENKYFSIGTTEVTSSNYTTANNATTTIPTSIEYTSSQRVRHYFLIPSNKTLSVIDKNAQVAVPITENTTHGITNHKLYYTNGAIASGGTVVITLS